MNHSPNRRYQISALSPGAIIFLVWAGIALAVALFIGVVWVQHQRALLAVSQRIGVQADWQAVRDYLFCEQLVSGTPVEQAYQILAQVGARHAKDYPFSAGDDYFQFADPNLAFELGNFQMVVRQGVLVDLYFPFNHNPGWMAGRYGCRRNQP